MEIFSILMLLQMQIFAGEAFIPQSLVIRTLHYSQFSTTTVRVSRPEHEVSSADDALQPTAVLLENSERESEELKPTLDEQGESKNSEELYRSLIKRSANGLKEQLIGLGLPHKGRKPDLAKRLVDFEMERDKIAIPQDETVTEEKEESERKEEKKSSAKNTLRAAELLEKLEKEFEALKPAANEQEKSERLYQSLMEYSGIFLKEQSKELGLQNKGKKSVLAKRLVEFYRPTILQEKKPTEGKTESVSKKESSPEVSSAQDALQRTALHLEKLKKKSEALKPRVDEQRESTGSETLYRSLIQQSANSLKEQLKELGLSRRGRKPDLAERLVEYEMEKSKPAILREKELMKEQTESVWTEGTSDLPIGSFAGLPLSVTAGKALGSASFSLPSPIQEAAIKRLSSRESAILHAETGSGKTLAYLLPITEALWNENDDDEARGFGVILTPTRELAAQVAGIAQALAPPGSVRLIFQPTNLMGDPLKEHGEEKNGGLLDRSDGRASPRLYVGSAKVIMTSLYGDSKMPASPTKKPEAMFFIRNVRWLVMDEVDRLLHVQKSRSESRFKQHERPAAIIASAVTRMTLGQTQTISVSATVGRPLRRELSRVLGLSPDECPDTIRGSSSSKEQNIGRAVTIPDLVQNYVFPIQGSSSGKLLTAAFKVINKLNKKPRKMLLVLTRGCEISTKNTIGALKHFQCRPEPISLLDALEAEGSDRMIEIHRQVSGATGVGETGYFKKQDEKDEDESTEEYLLVTGEDTIRGLHLDGLDLVIIVGRPQGPDEYTHIAGRTGRAGKNGKVISVVSSGGAAHITSWERMLDVAFDTVTMKNIESIYQ